MRFSGLLQAELIGILAALGHTDTIVIADAGLPIPQGVHKIDLAVAPGLPSFMQLCSLVAVEFPIEAVTIASEMRGKNQTLFDMLKAEIDHWGTEHKQPVAVKEVAHEELKELTKQAKLIVRSGEFSPYANIVIRAGVAF